MVREVYQKNMLIEKSIKNYADGEIYQKYAGREIYQKQIESNKFILSHRNLSTFLEV
jgi:hypothetical protein